MSWQESGRRDDGLESVSIITAEFAEVRREGEKSFAHSASSAQFEVHTNPQGQLEQIWTGTQAEGSERGGRRAEEVTGAGINSVLTADERRFYGSSGLVN